MAKSCQIKTEGCPLVGKRWRKNMRRKISTYTCYGNLSLSGCRAHEEQLGSFSCVQTWLMGREERRCGEERGEEKRRVEWPHWSSRPASFHHLQRSQGINETKHLLYVALLAGEHPDFSPGFYRSLGDNILLQGGFRAGFTVDAEDLCNMHLSVKKPTRRICAGKRNRWE